MVKRLIRRSPLLHWRSPGRRLTRQSKRRRFFGQFGLNTANPTDRYPHNIMGNRMAHTDLIVGLEPCPQCSREPGTGAVRCPSIWSSKISHPGSST